MSRSYLRFKEILDGLEGVRKEPVEAIRRSKGFGQIDGLGFFGNIEKTFVPLTCLLLGFKDADFSF